MLWRPTNISLARENPSQCLHPPAYIFLIRLILLKCWHADSSFLYSLKKTWGLILFSQIKLARPSCVWKGLFIGTNYSLVDCEERGWEQGKGAPPSRHPFYSGAAPTERPDCAVLPEVSQMHLAPAAFFSLSLVWLFKSSIKSIQI